MKSTTFVLLPNIIFFFPLVHCNKARGEPIAVVSSNTNPPSSSPSAFIPTTASTQIPTQTDTHIAVTRSIRRIGQLQVTLSRSQLLLRTVISTETNPSLPTSSQPSNTLTTSSTNPSTSLTSETLSQNNATAQSTQTIQPSSSTPQTFSSLSFTSTTENVNVPTTSPPSISTTTSVEVNISQSSTSSSQGGGLKIGGTALPTGTPSPNGSLKGVDIEAGGIQGPEVTETKSLKLFTPTTVVVDVPGATTSAAAVATDEPVVEVEKPGLDKGSPSTSPVEGGDVPVTTQDGVSTSTTVLPTTTEPNTPGNGPGPAQPQPTDPASALPPPSNINTQTQTTPLNLATPIPILNPDPNISTPSPSPLPTGLTTVIVTQTTRLLTTITRSSNFTPNPSKTNVVVVVDGIPTTLIIPTIGLNGTTALTTPIPTQTLPVLQVISSSISGSGGNGGGNGTSATGEATGRVVVPTAILTSARPGASGSAVPGGLLPDVDGSGGERLGLRKGMGWWMIGFVVGIVGFWL